MQMRVNAPSSSRSLLFHRAGYDRSGRAARAAPRGRPRERGPPRAAADDGQPRGQPSIMLRFLPPVLIHGAWNASAPVERLDANESAMDSFYALTDDFLFGQYESHLSGGEAVFVASSDSGRSWGLSQIWRPPPVTVGPACQLELDAFCNNETLVGADCLDPQRAHYNRSMSPMVGLRDEGLQFGVAWRCYSHESLTRDMKHWSAHSKTPNAFCSRPGPALEQLARTCATSSPGAVWAGAEQALTGHGARSPGTLRTLGVLQVLPEDHKATAMSSPGSFELSVLNGSLNIKPTGRGLTFRSLPRSMSSQQPGPSKKHPWQCNLPAGKPFYEPVSSVVLPDGSFLAANILCFDTGSPSESYNANLTARRYNHKPNATQRSGRKKPASCPPLL
jgi:hypothetical protein